VTERKAEEFIASHIKEFGLAGSNTPQNEPKFPRLIGSSALYFSKKNHFVWGYNGDSYINRRSSSCMYYTDYLKQPSTGTILSLDRSLVDIAEQLYKGFMAWQNVYVINRGRFEDYAFIEACKEAGTDFHQVVLRYEDCYVPFDSTVTHSTIHITSDLLLDTARAVVPWLRTKSIDVIQDIAIARSMTFEEQLIYPSRMKFVNHNHDGEKVCGPAYWALCDAEEDTALLRYDWFEEGVTRLTTNLATWSPELMDSQLDHPEMKRCMTRTTANADLATENMWKSVSPEPYEFTDKPDWWEGVQEEINEMHDGGKYNEKWHTPVYRLLGHGSASYGTVI
jgi:hypothetical protein